MHLSITPLDTVFFRDGKAFTMGEETQADGLFPPPPAVLRGALRTRYFTEHPDELRHAATENDPTAETRITGMGLRNSDTGMTYFPVPRDLVHRKDAEKESEMVLARPVKSSPRFVDSSTLEAPLTHPATVESPGDAYLESLDLEHYLSSAKVQKASFWVTKQHDLVQSEPKIGIMRNRDTGGAQEGHLYRVGFRRLKQDIAFAVKVDGLKLDKSGLLKLGGEHKAAYYETVDSSWPLPKVPVSSIEETECLRLYLATPALFQQGWLPSWVDPDTHEAHLGGCRLKLYSAAVGKPSFIGGWNMKKRRPKPMRKAVPSGSVYYFKLTDGSVDDLVQQVHGQSISDYRTRDGFGICYVGVAPPPKAG
ncbi:MAG: type III-B CRISPR module-associated protein Cmr3 [Longimonas sp.]|uniref:type III-B CRISPR module-associated protein Cmr3 n=1 Tax=Longimonas sp. TaxID=2039626 RepID=UPI00335F100F